MKHIILLVLILVAGCSTIPQADMSTEQPELISSIPLPAYTQNIPPQGLRFNVLVHVMKDGGVSGVKMLGTSGDADWDSLTIQSMKQWRYSAPRSAGAPVDLWMRQLVVVQFQQPVMRTLAVLISSSMREADSLHALLEKGIAYDSLVKELSAPASAAGRYLGSVDISSYPRPVRDELKKLREDEISRPVRLGDKYLIYKRIKKEASPVIPE